MAPRPRAGRRPNAERGDLEKRHPLAEARSGQMPGGKYAAAGRRMIRAESSPRRDQGRSPAGARRRRPSRRRGFLALARLGRRDRRRIRPGVSEQRGGRRGCQLSGAVFRSPRPGGEGLPGTRKVSSGPYLQPNCSGLSKPWNRDAARPHDECGSLARPQKG